VPCFGRSDTSTARALRGETGRSFPTRGCSFSLRSSWGATLFGSLWAIAEEGNALAASLVTTGVAVSLLPVLIGVLPPLTRDARTSERDDDYAVAIVGLFLYVLCVGAVIALINID
jgi:hypothetical protein